MPVAALQEGEVLAPGNTQVLCSVLASRPKLLLAALPRAKEEDVVESASGYPLSQNQGFILRPEPQLAEAYCLQRTWE